MRAILSAFVLISFLFTAMSAAQEKLFYRGADLSMLPVLESAGMKYRDGDKPIDDLVPWFVGQGCNLVRVRLFVDPSPDYDKTHGAIQNLPAAIAIAKRAKSAGAAVLLDLHYSDTWADPKQQFKPAAWDALTGDALLARVRQYNAETIASFQSAGVSPDIVQVGNEIAFGMIWPDGKLAYDATNGPESWATLASLVNAGVAGVRDAEKPSQPIRTMIHIHGGGQQGVPAWFFNNLHARLEKYDFIGLSFYPADGESIDHLKTNLHTLAEKFDRDIIVVETAFPHRDVPQKQNADLPWPRTPAGQAAFLADLETVIRATPNNRGQGWVYWYPESIPMPDRWTWKAGAMALFDRDGRSLPAIHRFNPKRD